MALIKLCSEPKISKCSPSSICPVFSYVLEQISNVTLSENPDNLCNCESEISNVCNAVKDHCLQAMKILHHHTNSCFDWLIFGQQSVDPPREAISILSGEYKRFTFVHPVVPCNKMHRAVHLRFSITVSSACVATDRVALAT